MLDPVFFRKFLIPYREKSIRSNTSQYFFLYGFFEQMKKKIKLFHLQKTNKNPRKKLLRSKYVFPLFQPSKTQPILRH